MRPYEVVPKGLLSLTKSLLIETEFVLHAPEIRAEH